MPSKVAKHFAEETTVHAIKDFYYATVIGKIFWGTLGVVAVVGLALQLEGVMDQYINEDIGASMTDHFPPHLPTITICPDRWISAEKADEYALTDKSVSVINGFMATKGISQLFSFQSENSYEVEEMIINAAFGYKDEYYRMLKLWRDLGGSLEGLVEKLAFEELDPIGFAEVYPLGAEVERSRMISMNGVCFKYKALLRVNAIQSTYAGMKIAFAMQRDMTRRAIAPDVGVSTPFFKVVLDSEHEKNIVSNSDITFRYGTHYLVLYRVTKISRVSRRKWPCITDTSGDTTQCTIGHGNAIAKGKKGVLTDDGCETPIPASMKFEASKTDLPCNTFVDIQGSAMFQYINLTYTDQEWNQICPRPCIFSKYEYTVQIVRVMYDNDPTDNTSYSIVEAKAAEGIGGVAISEYLTVTISSMLSNVGGTLGLWLGASVMSLFQALYIFCLQRLIEKSAGVNGEEKDLGSKKMSRVISPVAQKPSK